MDKTDHKAMAERMILAAIAFFALALRVYRSGYRELWFDEIGQARIAQQGWWDAVLGAAKHAGAAPLDYLITHWTLYISQDEAILRLPAALFGTGAVVLVYLLGLMWFGRTAGITAALLLAITPFHVRYSQEVRFYSLAVFMALGCVTLFWQAQQRNTWRWWAVWGAVLAVGLYAHYYLTFIALGCGLWALIFRRDLVGRVTLAAGIAGAVFWPWVRYDNFVQEGPQLALRWDALITKATWRDLLNAPLGRDDEPLVWGLWGLFALAVLTLPWSRQRRALALSVLAGICALTGAYLLDVMSGYPFYPRQALVALPFLLLAGVGGLLTLLAWHTVAQVAAAGLVIVALWAFVPDLRAFYPPGYADNGLAATGVFVSQHIGVNDAIVVGGDATRVWWYAPHLDAYTPPFVRRTLDKSLTALANEYDRLWIVLWTNQQARRDLQAWAQDHAAWDVTPWQQGATRILIYSAHDPDAGITVTQEILRSPALSRSQRRILRQRLADQLEARGRADESVAFRRCASAAPLCTALAP